MKKQKTILLADDDQLIIECYSEVLKMSFPNYNLEIFENGTSLKGRLEKSVENVRVVITDYHMPGITGGVIIKKYAKSENFRKITFILQIGRASFRER